MDSGSIKNSVSYPVQIRADDGVDDIMAVPNDSILYRTASQILQQF